MDSNKINMDDSTNVIPLNSLINTVRIRLQSAMSEIAAETNMPAYLLDGIVCELLSDIRKREIEELCISAANKEDVTKT